LQTSSIPTTSSLKTRVFQSSLKPHIHSTSFHRTRICSSESSHSPAHNTLSHHTKTRSRNQFHSGIHFIPKPQLLLDTQYILHVGIVEDESSHPPQTPPMQCRASLIMTAYYSNAFKIQSSIIISYDVVYLATKLSFKFNVLRGSEEIID